MKWTDMIVFVALFILIAIGVLALSDCYKTNLVSQRINISDAPIDIDTMQKTLKGTDWVYKLEIGDDYWSSYYIRVNP